MHLLAAGVHHLDVLAHVDGILLCHLERLADAGRAHLELVVVKLCAEPLLQVAAQLCAILNPHPVGVVDLYNDAVVGLDADVNEEVLVAFQPLFDDCLYCILVNHIVVSLK